VILRRRDDLAMVMRELGDELFATRGNVDDYFKWNIGPKLQKFPELVPVSEAEMLDLTNIFGLVRSGYPGKLIDTASVKSRIQQHIRTAPEREAAALRKAKGRNK
jgi:hypothetical protein